MLKPSAMRDAFLRQILARMENDDIVFFVSADLARQFLITSGKIIRSDSSMLVLPSRTYQCVRRSGDRGFKVLHTPFAPFITMRCFEQLRVDLALLSEVRTMNVNLIGVGAVIICRVRSTPVL